MVRTMITDAQKPIDLAVIDVAALYAASGRGRSKPPPPCCTGALGPAPMPDPPSRSIQGWPDGGGPPATSDLTGDSGLRGGAPASQFGKCVTPASVEAGEPIVHARGGRGSLCRVASCFVCAEFCVGWVFWSAWLDAIPSCLRCDACHHWAYCLTCNCECSAEFARGILHKRQQSKCDLR